MARGYGLSTADKQQQGTIAIIDSEGSIIDNVHADLRRKRRLFKEKQKQHARAIAFCSSKLIIPHIMYYCYLNVHALIFEHCIKKRIDFQKYHMSTYCE